MLLIKFIIVPTFDTKVTENLRSGWVFFLQTNFDFLTSHFWQKFFISFKRYRCLELKFEKIFYLWSFFVKLWGFKDCHFGQFGTINARYISCFNAQAENLSVLKSFQSGWKKLNCHNWFVTMSEIYPIVLYMACGWMIFIKNFKLKIKLHFI